MGKKWYQSKTVGMGVLGLVGGFATFFMTGDVEALGTSVMGVLMIALRLITHKPLE